MTTFIGLPRRTPRGFMRIDFKDRNGSKCSLQESSLVTSEIEGTAIWFGVDEDFQGMECTRMEMSQRQLRMILPYLIEFAIFGWFGHHPAEHNLKGLDLENARHQVHSSVMAFSAGIRLRIVMRWILKGLFNNWQL